VGRHWGMLMTEKSEPELVTSGPYPVRVVTPPAAHPKRGMTSARRWCSVPTTHTFYQGR
jgi:hypothetical protein